MLSAAAAARVDASTPNPRELRDCMLGSIGAPNPDDVCIVVAWNAFVSAKPVRSMLSWTTSMTQNGKKGGPCREPRLR